MRTLILTIAAIFTFGFTNAQSVQDTSKTKVIYPIGQVADSSFIEALIVEDLNKPLMAKKYCIITEYWLFDKETGKQPEPFKQKVVDMTGAVISNFRDNVIWSKQLPKRK